MPFGPENGATSGCSTTYDAGVELTLFEQVADLVRLMTHTDLGDVRLRHHRRGIKLWFDAEQPPKEHYEAQRLSRRYVDGEDGVAIEIGFHTEHTDTDRNVAVIETMLAAEKEWRTTLGEPAEAGAFFGPEAWRRVSEAWIEPDLDDPDLAFEIAGRLVDYMTALEPVRRRPTDADR